MSSWKLRVWSPYNKKNQGKIDKFIERYKLHRSILYEFTNQDIPETQDGIRMKVLGLLHSRDTDIENISRTCMSDLSFVISENQLSGYEDVYYIDDSIIESIEDISSRYSDDVFVFELYHDDLYRGHVFGYWFKEFPQNIVLYGIRSSILNTLVKQCGADRRHIGAKLLSEIIATTSENVNLFVMAPLPGILPTLGALHFQKNPKLEDESFLEHARIPKDNFWMIEIRK